MVVAYTKLSEQSAKALPVWEFFGMLEEAERRYEQSKKKK